MGSVDKRTLDERVYDQLCENIISGNLKPGETVTLRGLAASFGTSLMPVRNAVNRLTVEHALDALPNRSITVPKLSVEEFNEMSEIRISLESLATRLATVNISQSQLDELEALNETMRKAAPAEYFRLNRQFHFGVYRCAQRPVLLDLIKGAWLRVGPLLNSFESHATELPTVTHDWTIAALRRKDPDDAAASIAADIRSAAHILRNMILASDKSDQQRIDEKRVGAARGPAKKSSSKRRPAARAKSNVQA